MPAGSLNAGGRTSCSVNGTVTLPAASSARSPEARSSCGSGGASCCRQYSSGLEGATMSNSRNWVTPYRSPCTLREFGESFGAHDGSERRPAGFIHEEVVEIVRGGVPNTEAPPNDRQLLFDGARRRHDGGAGVRGIEVRHPEVVAA